MALVDHGHWVLGVAGVAIVGYSFYLRAAWRRLKAQGGRRPVRASVVPRFQNNLQELTDGRIMYVGPFWWAFLLVGVACLARYVQIVVR